VAFTQPHDAADDAGDDEDHRRAARCGGAVITVVDDVGFLVETLVEDRFDVAVQRAHITRVGLCRTAGAGGHDDVLLCCPTGISMWLRVGVERGFEPNGFRYGGAGVKPESRVVADPTPCANLA
jgi:hypothetical protein